MRKFGSNTARWAATAFFTACWAYALVTRCTNFFLALRTDKIILLGAAIVVTGLISVFIFQRLLPRITSIVNPKAIARTAALSALVAAVLLLFIFPPLYFPEHHLLEIMPHLPSHEGNLSVISIHRYELPRRELLGVPPSIMDLQGSWHMDSGSDTITWAGDPEARISYARLMQAGVKIRFKTGPQEGEARIIWDGQEHILNLKAPSESTESITLMPALDWQRADLTRKVLVGFALAAEFLGLSAIICILSFLPKVFTIRNSIIIVACAAALLTLIPLVNAADPPVQFQDPHLEAAVRGILKQPDGIIRQHKLLTIAKLDASSNEIVSLDGIQHLRNLASLNLRDNHIPEITQISQLTRLNDLNLRGNAVSDITPLAALTNLESLNLRDNPITDISPLSNLTNLRELNLQGIPLGDKITLLRGFPDLNRLNIRSCAVTDISLLAELMRLTDLNLRGNDVSDITPLATLTKMESLNLRDNPITDLSPLSKLTRLHDLDLRGNAVSDITPLVTLTKMESLNLRDNPITDLSPLSKLTRLRELNLRGNAISDINPLSSLNNLESLNLRANRVGDISTLAELMSHGTLQDDPISGTRAEVDIRDNPIPRQPTDGYASIRPFWEHISDRVPFTLSVFNTLDTPSFSHIGGFYEVDFRLTLSSQDPQAVIHYTLNGSEPTQDSPLYNQPLQISSRTGQPNELSSISTTSYNWEEPIGEVFKATVVRAKAFHPDGAHSAAATHTYFVDQSIDKRYSLPIVSITADPDHFFDYDQGIYVMGRVYGEQNDYEEWRWWHPANYHLRGKGQERPMHIEFFDPSGERFLAQDGGVRIHGGVSRSYQQKALRLYADAQYGRADFFDYELFPGLRDSVQDNTIADFKTLLLHNSGNDWNFSMFRDAMMQSLVSHTNLNSRAYRPVVVFLNGEYWGIHNLRERLDPHYLAAHYQIDPNQSVILENNGILTNGEPGDEAHYQILLDYILNNDIKDPKHYSYVTTQMDIDNFIDYQITEIYISNSDWPQKNIKFWRYKTDTYQPNAPYGQDGRWRWFLFDTDFGFGLVESFQHDTLTHALQQTETDDWSSFLFRSLIENSEFRSQFINRFADHLNTSFTQQRVISTIDEMQDTLEPEMAEHIRRWRTMENSMDVWEKNVEVMRVFARQRPDEVRGHILEYFDLTGTAVITLLTDSTKGHILVNSIDITFDTPGVIYADEWSGTYFKGIPVSLSAIPKPGYQFAGWEGIDQSDPDVNLALNEDLTLTANFIPSEK